MTGTILRKAAVLCLAGVLAACGGDGKKDATADDFVARANGELLEIGKESARAGWVQLTYITPDTEALAAKANEREQASYAKVIAETKKLDADAI
jgi:hypothetical protein